MEIFHADFRIISEIQRAKFGILLAYMFGGKIWGSGSDTNFRGKFCGQAPPNHLIRKSPWEHGTLSLAQDSEVKSIINRVRLPFSSAFIPHFVTLVLVIFQCRTHNQCIWSYDIYLITEVLPDKQCHSETERVLMHGHEQNCEHYCSWYHSVSVYVAWNLSRDYQEKTRR